MAQRAALLLLLSFLPPLLLPALLLLSFLQLPPLLLPALLPPVGAARPESAAAGLPNCNNESMLAPPR